MLERFLANNPWSQVTPSEDGLVIEKPWGDSALVVPLPSADLAAADAILAELILPPRFEGIYHRNTATLELLYAQLPHDDSLIGREFRFNWQGRQSTCRYGASSPEAIFLAQRFRPVEQDIDFDFRGLGRINPLRRLELLGRLPDSVRKIAAERSSVSFYVSGVPEFVETDAVLMAKHLNFYMSYFWRRTPQIVVHEVTPQEAGPIPAPRKTSSEDLPSELSGVELDAYLLDLLLTAQRGNPRLRFIQYYQVLEYAAFYWTEDSVRGAVRRILSNPDLGAHLDEYVPRIIDALGPTRANDEHKIKRVVETAVDPKLLWLEIAPSLAFFSEPLRFDGGFVLDPLVSANCSQEAFASMWAPKVTDAIRLMRNALVHGRESRVQAVIAPTIANERRLLPWIPIIGRVAQQVAIYSAT